MTVAIPARTPITSANVSCRRADVTDGVAPDAAWVEAAAFAPLLVSGALPDTAARASTLADRNVIKTHTAEKTGNVSLTALAVSGNPATNSAVSGTIDEPIPTRTRRQLEAATKDVRLTDV